MPQLVKAPDGTLLKFPDDMSESEMLAAVQRAYPPTAAKPAAAPRAAAPTDTASGTLKDPIEWTFQNRSSIKPGQVFRYGGKLYTQTSGAEAPGAAPSLGDKMAASAVAGGRAATRNAIPVLAGGIPGAAVGAATGATIGTALGAFFPPAEVLTVPLGTLGGALYGGYAGEKAVGALQDQLTSYVPERVKKFFGQDKATIQRDVAEHPIATAVGSAAPGFVYARPTKEIGTLIAGGALGAGAEAVRQSYAGENFDPKRVLAMGAVGMGQAKPTAAGRALFGVPETAFERGARETIQPQGKPSQRSKADASADMRRTQGALQETGLTPRPIDILNPETTQRIVAPAAAASDEAARLVSKYRDTVAGPGLEGTQVAAQTAAADIDAIPGVRGTTTREVGDLAAGEITAAGESVQPGVKLGEASTEVARALAKQAAADKAAMEASYGATEQLGVSTVQMPRPGEGPWAPITPQQAKQYAKGAVNDPSNPLMFNAQTGEVAPRSQLGPQSVAEFNAELRDPISGFMEDPDSIKPVINVLNKLEQDSLSSLDTTNLFGARKRLSAIARDFKGAPAGIAADRVRRKLDEVMGVWGDNNRFSGPAEVVDSMRATTATARKYYRDWKSGNIAETLTETRFGPDGRETVLDPEAARRAMFGSLTDTNASLSSMKVLRDRLGADSAEWNALRQEALEQRVGVNTDKGKFIKNLETFERENPAMADLLLTPAEKATFTQAKGRVTAATDIQTALATGDAALTALPSDFSTAVSGLVGAPLRAAKVALRSKIEEGLGTPKGAVAMLDTLAQGTTARANVSTLLGPEAETLFRRAEALAARAQRAQSGAAVAEGARPPQREAEGVKAAEMAANARTGFAAPLVRFLQARGMNAKQALETVQDILDPAKTDAAIAQLETLYGENVVQAFKRRVRANVSNAPLVGGLPRRVGQLSAVAAAAPEGDKPEEPKPVAAPSIEDNVPSQEQSDADLLSFFGVDLNAPSPLPAPPTAAGEARAPEPTRTDGAPLSRDDLHAAVMYQESRGNPNAVSPKGAEGTMQVMRKTQLRPGFGVRPARDNSLAEKERVGHDYLDALVAHYKDVEHALMAYNWGPKNVDNWLAGSKRPIPRETRDYVSAILGGNR